jgi:hypothetical protein
MPSSEKQLIDAVYADTQHAADIIADIWSYRTPLRPRTTELLTLLRNAASAIQSLDLRAAGHKPPIEG